MVKNPLVLKIKGNKQETDTQLFKLIDILVSQKFELKKMKTQNEIIDEVYKQALRWEDCSDKLAKTVEFYCGPDKEHGYPSKAIEAYKKCKKGYGLNAQITFPINQDKKKEQKRVIYLIGSLRNKNVPIIANKLQKVNLEWEIFSSWFAPGPRADDYLRDYCKGKGLSYRETLRDYASTHIYQFDKFHLNRATDAILIMRAGRSCHLELGWASAKSKRTYVLFDETPRRVDIMYNFCTDVFFNFKDLVKELKKYD